MTLSFIDSQIILIIYYPLTLLDTYYDQKWNYEEDKFSVNYGQFKKKNPLLFSSQHVRASPSIILSLSSSSKKSWIHPSVSPSLPSPVTSWCGSNNHPLQTSLVSPLSLLWLLLTFTSKHSPFIYSSISHLFIYSFNKH